MGFDIGGRNITDLRYVDDTTLISDSIENMRQILKKVDHAGRWASLH